tara:strand:- start:609 stop:1151 length:543 start_codon:yes stop_codon:yes gene_type:complete
MNQGIINRLGDFYEYDVRVVWEDINGGVKSILSEDPNWMTLRPEDIYSMCSLGSANIWGYGEYPVRDVFCITKIDTCPYRRKKTLQLLIAWSVAKDPTVADGFNEIAKLLARRNHCSGIEIWTSSEKLSSYASTKGYDKTMYIKRMNLDSKPRYFKDEPHEDTTVEPILGIVNSKKGQDE